MEYIDFIARYFLIGTAGVGVFIVALGLLVAFLYAICGFISDSYNGYEEYGWKGLIVPAFFILLFLSVWWLDYRKIPV